MEDDAAAAEYHVFLAQSAGQQPDRGRLRQYRPPEVLDEHAVTKVVAARDGVVTQVRALEGQPMVQAGDAVQTGDTLISGLVEPTREGGKYRTAHAHGTVQAYTTHTVRAARPLTEQRSGIRVKFVINMHW